MDFWRVAWNANQFSNLDSTTEWYADCDETLIMLTMILSWTCSRTIIGNSTSQLIADLDGYEQKTWMSHLSDLQDGSYWTFSVSTL